MPQMCWEHFQHFAKFSKCGCNILPNFQLFQNLVATHFFVLTVTMLLYDLGLIVSVRVVCKEHINNNSVKQLLSNDSEFCTRKIESLMIETITFETFILFDHEYKIFLFKCISRCKILHSITFMF